MSQLLVIDKDELSLLIIQAVQDAYSKILASNNLDNMVAKPYPNNMRDSLAAEYIGVKPGTLRNWRSSGKGPSYTKHEKVVTYSKKDLDLYNAKRKVKTHD